MRPRIPGLEAADLLVVGGTIITQNANRDVIPEGAVAVRGSTIAAVGPAAQLQSLYQARKTVDARGRYIFPGLINTHTHLFQTMVKGLGEGLPLYQWCDQITAPSAAQMTEREAYLSAVLGILESIRSGTTTLLDFMYSLPRFSLYRAVGQAYVDLGLRGILARGLMDSGEQHGLSPCQFHPVDRALAECDELSAEFSSDRLSVALAPEIPFALRKEGFEALLRYARDRGMMITIHENEVDDDDRAVLADYGMRAVPFLESLGFWGPDILAVHCVKMLPEDIEIFARRQVNVSHCPVSNMYLGAGAAPILTMRQAGIPISLATDGAGSNNSQDMLETMKCAGLLQKVVYQDGGVISARDILDMATIEGAQAIGQPDRLGSLEAGKQADLFVMDPLRPKSAAVLDPIASLVYSTGQDSIVTTVVAGSILMNEGKITVVDEPAVLAECQQAALTLAKRVGTEQFFAHP